MNEHGRVAVVTGVSRPVGIGAAIVRRLLADDYAVLATGWSSYDVEIGSVRGGEEELSFLGELDSNDDRLHYLAADFADPETPHRVIATAVELFGSVDVLVANHAAGSIEPLDRVTAAELDNCWMVNARGSVLLAQAFDAVYDRTRSAGRLVLLTSGQHLRPMPGEIAYVLSKGAIQQMTLTLADYFADKGITVNCINPGPTDTKYLFGEVYQSVERGFPAQRWGQPEDVARLVAWLASEESQWVTGQTINSEGGWRGCQAP
jgi:3-oxoacyl-[acyl-carrier protein] reductase